MHLVILCHADPSVRASYQTRLAAAGVEAELVFANSHHPGMSSAYRALAAQLRARGGSLLGQLAAYAGASRPVADYEAVTLATFSAGYALAQDLLGEPAEAERVRGYVAIDSIHTALEADGTAHDAQLGPFVRHALRAAEPGSGRVCWVGHSDVQTPQRGRGAFASTTQVAAELRRLCGLTGEGSDVSSGGLRVRAYDLETSPTREHIAALTRWGPEWVADAVAMLAAGLPKLDIETQKAPTPEEPLGIRALSLARLEEVAGVREVPGPRHNARILAYLAGCERGGRVIGGALQRDEVAWCAAGASWCAYRAAVEGETVPHMWRASVRELWADAIASGAARGATMLRRGEYVPQPGDLLVMTRGGPAYGDGAAAFARTRGLGHVGRVVDWSGDGGRTLDGNVGDTWTFVERELAAQELVGAIAYPRPEVVEVTPGDDELHALARLIVAPLDLAAGAVGRLTGAAVTAIASWL